MAQIVFDVVGAGQRSVEIDWIFNGGYAGRDIEQVQKHVDELAALGVPGPTNVPTLYPLANSLASQTDSIQVPHGRTSGEAEWALIVGESVNDVLVTAACDHTDRALEVHGVAWSKQSAPDVLGNVAWQLADIEDSFDEFTLKAWVENDGRESLIQDGSPALLLPPSYWLDRLRDADLLRPRTMVMSATIAMIEGVDQFADAWRVELADGLGNVSQVRYRVEQLVEAWD